jgi:hypothetical protein
MSHSTTLMSHSTTHSTIFDHFVAHGAACSGALGGVRLGLGVLVVSCFLLGAKQGFLLYLL